MNDWQTKNPQYQVIYKNIWDSPKGMKEFKDFAKAQNITDLSVPLFRLGDQFFVGFSGAQSMPDVLSHLLHGAKDTENRIEVPFLGSLNTKEYGVFALTMILGLVDGFNPCAMWVLLILLFLLVNLKDRKKMFAISGVFVLVSGIVYFIFMSSWLLFYDWVELARPMQIVIGLLALIIGLVHVKDFFFFGKGLSFSIPNSLKPKIIRKARGLIKEESTLAVMLSVVGLAIFVNFIELMCTAGLPAIYTRILTDNGILGFERLFFLLMYCLFYMFDDALMVGVAVYTLSSDRLQESGGRFLKLLSGAVLLILSILMIFFPQLLILS